MKNFKLFFYIPFFWLPVVFAEYPIDLKGEWTKACVTNPKIGYYYTTKLAFFDKNQMVVSWKFYDNPQCTQLRGEYWEKWQITFEDSHPNDLGIFQITSTLIDGNPDRCKRILDIITLTTDNELYFGKTDYEAENYCEKRPESELQEPPYTFSHSTDQTIEEYIRSLRHYYIIEDDRRIFLQ